MNYTYYNIKKSKFILLYINLLIYMINIIFFFSLKKKIINYKKIFELKYSDRYILSLSKKKYKEISNFLNNKFNINYIFIKNKKKKIPIKKNKKEIFINVVDSFNNTYHMEWIKKKLYDKFIIIFDNNNPDYLIYNIFGNNHTNPKYNNAIKIALYTENKIPDLNEADYALGHYHINYLDRYFKCSIFLWQKNQDIQKIRENVLKNKIRKKFCAAVISNSIQSDLFRLKFINELNKYKKIDMAGKYNNNIGRRISNKTEFLSSYKFSIAMENSNGDGYVSEKIIDSFRSGTIPIYYGDYMIDEYINPKAYILIKGEKDMYKKIEYIKQIDNNDEIYKSLLKEKVLLDNHIVIDTEKELKEFLCHIFEQDKIKAFRKMF